MVLLVLGILVGFVVAAFSGGKIADIRRQKLRIWWTLPLAALLFLLPLVVNDLGGAGTMHALGYAALMAFGAANLQLTGIPVVMVGIALNLVPLAFNGTVPVSEAGAVTAEIGTVDTIADTDFGAARTLEDGSMRFIFLGDTIPVGLLTQIYSFGDLIIAFGLANVMYRVVKPRKERFDDEQAGWPESTVPTEDVSSDPWTAMLRGEIDDADFAAKTGPQPSVVAAAAAQSEWVQDPPVDTGPMMIMGATNSDAGPAPANGDANADEDAPDALDLSLTWADEPASPESPAAAEPEPPTAVPPSAPSAPSAPAAPEVDRSPFAPPPAAVVAGAAAAIANSNQDETPAPSTPTSSPAVFDHEAAAEPAIATPSSPTPPLAPPQTAPRTAPSTPSAPLAPPVAPAAPPSDVPTAPVAPAAPPPVTEPSPQPENAPPEPEAHVEGRSFAPQLPDMDADNSDESAFAAALAAFDDERRSYGEGSDSEPPANSAPEHDTGPMPIIEPHANETE